MMKKREYILWVVSFYVLTAALLLVGTFYDLQMDKALYNPKMPLRCFCRNTAKCRVLRFGDLPRLCCMLRANCSSAGFGTG